MSTNKKPTTKPHKKRLVPSSRGLNQALQTQKRTNRLAEHVIDSVQISDKRVNPQAKAVNIFGQDQLKIIFLGGQNGIGEKNMIVLEYDQDALVLDCGNELGLDLPGVNYAICDVSYLDKIKKKLKGYVLSHGHLDHIGGLPHILPKFPAPIYGSVFNNWYG